MAVLITIDRSLKKPLFRQIIDNTIVLMDNGSLRPGDRLLASRILARRLGVNRSTVSRAYEELWSLGYLEARSGSYSRVRARPGAPGKSDPAPPAVPAAKFKSAPAAEALLRAARKERLLLDRAGRPGVINFIPLSPDPALIPAEEFRKSMNRALAQGGVGLLQYGDPKGFEPLRRTIARRMRLHGVAVSAEEVLITQGAQQGLDLLIKLLAGPGRAVAVEAPTYSRALDLFRLAGLELVETPLAAFGREKAGPDLETLAACLKQNRPAFVYTIPNFHNPTGLTTGQAHRERLLELCAGAGIPLIEDGFEEELKYFGRVARPIKSMDRGGAVIYLGTFSKVLFPGLRIGWAAASRTLIDRLAAINQASLISANLPGQAALDDFCRRGLFESHIRKMHRVYRRRMFVALAALEEHLDPDLVAWTRPEGGYVIWLELKRPPDRTKHLTEEALVEGLLERGLAVMPGGPHFFSRPPGLFLRLSIAHLDRTAIGTGIRRLAQGLTELPLTP